jgi:ribosomal protein S18 acetylase RimI-like enzyme
VTEHALALHTCDAAGARRWIPVVHCIYAAAFGEPPYLETEDDVQQWLNDLDEQLGRPGFALVLATQDREPVGFAYGYTMTADVPRWHRIVEPFHSEMPREALVAGRIFTLMEFAVLNRWRRSGIGRALHDRLLSERDEPLALLTVREDAQAAQAAYKAWGWRMVGHRPREDGPGYDVLVKILPAGQGTVGRHGPART